jgi:3-deoxy-D-manno-octulosonic acid hydroxylase-like protein
LPTISAFRHTGWTDAASPDTAGGAAATLEQGAVLFLPDLSFPVDSDEASMFAPAAHASAAKNTSYDPSSGHVGGTTLGGDNLRRLQRLMTRFSDSAAALVHNLLPRYRGRIERARASFRPCEIGGRAMSWRKDDSRLHIDSFPATPVHGRRILRVFSNVNPVGQPRSWRVGQDFEAVAARFDDALSLPWPGSAAMLAALHVTKTRRSLYDSLMLRLHDAMKADADFQARSEQTPMDFPAGSTWIALTDQVSHAAMSGQYQLEQTFLLPIDALIDESRSPLRILERMKGRRLA